LIHERCVSSPLLLGIGIVILTMRAAVAADAQTAEMTAGLQRAKLSVIGSVSETRASRRRSSHGDEIIVTTAVVRVSESLRGNAPAWVSLDVEGGTLNGVTLEVSDTPLLRRGDRAVFLIEQLPDRRYVPLRGGAGIFKLKPDDSLENLPLTLNDVRRLARDLQ
jgi:hypothetical protein